MERGVRLGEPAVGTAVHDHGRLAGGRLDATHLALRLEASRDLDPEVDRHPRLGLVGMMIEKDVVPVGAKARVLAEKRQTRSSAGLKTRGISRGRGRSPNCGQQSWPELLDLHAVVHPWSL